MRFLLILLFLTGICAPAFSKITDSKIISGTVLLKEKTAPSMVSLLAQLKKEWKLHIDSSDVNDKTMVCTSGSATIMFAYLDYPAPQDELMTAAAISWIWKTALQEAPAHQAQMVISVIGSESRVLELYMLFTKAAAAALETNESIGVLMNDQLLLLSRGYYLEAARNMSADVLPVSCWVYFGLVQEEGKSGAFTYGLKEFGLKEMEIVDSSHPLPEVQSVLNDAVQYVLKYQVKVMDGQEVPLEGGKLGVHISKAVYLNDEESVKIQF